MIMWLFIYSNIFIKERFVISVLYLQVFLVA